jgi:hypothetical protein
VKAKLFLYCHLHVSESHVQLLLQWWKDHAKQSPRMFLGIVSFQIKAKHIFNIVRILTKLRRCWLGVQNLDKLVMILKNWPSDVRTNYPSPTTMRMVEFLKVKNKMLDNFKEELDDVGYFDSLE